MWQTSFDSWLRSYTITLVGDRWPNTSQTKWDRLKAHAQYDASIRYSSGVLRAPHGTLHWAYLESLMAFGLCFFFVVLELHLLPNAPDSSHFGVLLTRGWGSPAIGKISGCYGIFVDLSERGVCVRERWTKSVKSLFMAHARHSHRWPPTTFHLRYCCRMSDHVLLFSLSSTLSQPQGSSSHSATGRSRPTIGWWQGWCKWRY